MATTTPPPQPPTPIIRSDPNNPYPTTFVQADPSSFKLLVQSLTGPTPDPNQPIKPNLYQRRNLRFCPDSISGLSGWTPDHVMLSPVTPLMPDPFTRFPVELDWDAEEKAIAEKGFYLHPSPATTPRESEPQLLPLFPVTSPRGSGLDSGH